jgi:hypothetical protein
MEENNLEVQASCPHMKKPRNFLFLTSRQCDKQKRKSCAGSFTMGVMLKLNLLPRELGPGYRTASKKR